MTNKNISDLFNKFSGLEIHAVETVNPERSYSQINVEPVQSSAVVDELKKVAEDAGFNLRLVFPGVRYVNGYKRDRLNAYLEKSGDGKYRISRFDVQ